ncbi:MAG: molybdenum cofactor guanylyltransferase [Hyphomicrobiales bacterium]|nr:MAG: molybdenum cofactor guanylyltransferase [Hyphomicrobiales bacterium]
MSVWDHQSEKILGVVLAGGQSRRMGDVDKSMLQLGGMALVEHAVKRLQGQVDAMVLNTNAEPPTAFEYLKLPILKDVITGYAGPLAGILTAMEYAETNGFQWVASAAADTPFFPKNYVKSMMKHENSAIILASSGGHRHPTFGLWRASLAPSLRHFLTEGSERKILLFVQQHPWAMAEFDIPSDKNSDPFFNINTPQDFQLAERTMQTMETAGEH